MSLDALFMPLPAGAQGQRVQPLGEWPQRHRPMTAEERKAKDLARWTVYRRKHREARNAQRQRKAVHRVH